MAVQTTWEWETIDREKQYKLLVSWKAPCASPDVAGADKMKEQEKRNEQLKELSVVSETPFKEPVCSVVPMDFYEEALCVGVWFMFFGYMLYTPLYLLFLLYSDPRKALQLVLLLAILSVSTRKFFRPNDCRSYLSGLMLKYFSHTGLWKENLPMDRPSIIVGPPHGVFPFGSFLACISIPRITGCVVRGLAANALLRIPFIGARLAALGLVDASRDNARKMLLDNWSLGISSGGIAEIFETCRFEGGEGCETIILKSRGGICKLALETGAYLVPSYIFGNTLCLHVWSDPWGIMRSVSRRLRISICFFTGRFGLPIPYRTPILGVLGAAIVVPKTENPPPEMVQSLLDKLCADIHALFELHKAAYGWQNVKLVIK